MDHVAEAVAATAGTDETHAVLHAKGHGWFDWAKARLTATGIPWTEIARKAHWPTGPDAASPRRSTYDRFGTPRQAFTGSVKSRALLDAAQYLGHVFVPSSEARKDARWTGHVSLGGAGPRRGPARSGAPERSSEFTVPSLTDVSGRE